VRDVAPIRTSFTPEALTSSAAAISGARSMAASAIATTMARPMIRPMFLAKFGPRAVIVWKDCIAGTSRE